MSKTHRQITGDAAEQAAEDHLASQGLKPVARNYRCAFGEIDLIMRDKKTLVFIEVRARKNTHFASAVETVTKSKQKKIILSAQQFMLENKTSSREDVRFDVVGISPELPLQWIENAFQVFE